MTVGLPRQDVPPLQHLRLSLVMPAQSLMASAVAMEPWVRRLNICTETRFSTSTQEQEGDLSAVPLPPWLIQVVQHVHHMSHRGAALSTPQCERVLLPLRLRSIGFSAENTRRLSKVFEWKKDYFAPSSSRSWCKKSNVKAGSFGLRTKIGTKQWMRRVDA